MRTIISLLMLNLSLFAFNQARAQDYEGPYSTAMDNVHPLAADAGIAGFIGPSGRGAVPSATDPNNFINPVFSRWASGYVDYIPAPAADPCLIGSETYTQYGGVSADWRKWQDALGPPTGDIDHVCVLGDLWPHQIAVLDPDHPEFEANDSLSKYDPNKIQPGSITLTFDEPIQNGPGPDFAVFENGTISQGGAGVSGQIFAELAFVEVSTDGANFARFPAVSLTQPPEGQENIGPFATIDATMVYNLAGKHVNAYGQSWATPFNLSDLQNHPAVTQGLVDIQNINYVRIVDVPGSGFFTDSASSLIDPQTIDPNTAGGGTYYSGDHGILDPWVTWGTGGHDLEAVGAIRQIYGDADSDCSVDLEDFVRLAGRWRKYGNWPQGDFDENLFVDRNDLMLLAENWLYQCPQTEY